MPLSSGDDEATEVPSAFRAAGFLSVFLGVGTGFRFLAGEDSVAADPGEADDESPLRPREISGSVLCRRGAEGLRGAVREFMLSLGRNRT